MWPSQPDFAHVSGRFRIAAYPFVDLCVTYLSLHLLPTCSSIYVCTHACTLHAWLHADVSAHIYIYISLQKRDPPVHSTASGSDDFRLGFLR